ncbi:methylated-DNA--[protein]-cysteine S-methyltransferase [Varibaculum prostatecancerukia]|uniref:methylated-DNA--[protein]-cysteine S-methyltransferase n=1 Tax=Varibaculum prostatecancerukia TaxID=2811781 RepID=UPI00286961E6|nr:methylated-DNA--[protein]-cysteine S-methyltransferase [Varibaculum prostatecancerukia]
MRQTATDTFIQFYDSPLGELAMRSDGSALIGLGLASQQAAVATAAGTRPQEKSLPIFQETARWLDSYFRGRAPSFTPKLKLSGSDFQKRVCEIMLTIPFGETVTYGEIAARIARERGIPRMSAQAVGGAVGANPILIIVPCHRVIGAGGNLTGYGAGMERKIQLLKLENVDMTSLFVPKKNSVAKKHPLPNKLRPRPLNKIGVS